MRDEDKACIDDFIHSLHAVAEADQWLNTTILASIRVYKYECEHPTEDVVIFDPNKRVYKRRDKLVGNSVQNQDDSILIELLSGEHLKIITTDRCYKAALAYHIKLHNPEMIRSVVAEQAGYTSVSSVDKGIAQVMDWCANGRKTKNKEHDYE